MYYSIPDCMFFAMILGLCFGVVYEILRLLRKLLPYTAVTVICDVTFFVISAFAVFRLSEALGNDVRIYTIIGYGAGVFAYINTFGRLINKAESAVIGALHSAAGAICRFFKRIFAPVFGSIAHIASTGLVTIHDFWKRHKKIQKKHLKSDDDECYNKIYIRNNVGENSNVIRAQVRKGASNKA